MFLVVPGGEAEGGSKLGRAEEGDEGEGERGEEVEEIGGQGRPTKYGMFLLEFSRFFRSWQIKERHQGQIAVSKYLFRFFAHDKVLTILLIMKKGILYKKCYF